MCHKKWRTVVASIGRPESSLYPQLLLPALFCPPTPSLPLPFPFSPGETHLKSWSVDRSWSAVTRPGRPDSFSGSAQLAAASTSCRFTSISASCDTHERRSRPCSRRFHDACTFTSVSGCVHVHVSFRMRARSRQFQDACTFTSVSGCVHIHISFRMRARSRQFQDACMFTSVSGCVHVHVCFRMRARSRQFQDACTFTSVSGCMHVHVSFRMHARSHHLYFTYISRSLCYDGRCTVTSLLQRIHVHAAFCHTCTFVSVS